MDLSLLDEILNELFVLKQGLYSELDMVSEKKAEEQEAYDNIPASLQQSQRAEDAYEALVTLESLDDHLNDGVLDCGQIRQQITRLKVLLKTERANESNT